MDKSSREIKLKKINRIIILISVLILVSIIVLLLITF